MAFCARTNPCSSPLKPRIRSICLPLHPTLVKGYTKETGKSSYESGQKARSTAEEFLRQAEEKPYSDRVSQGEEKSWSGLKEETKEEVADKVEKKADNAVKKTTGNENYEKIGED
ncbi:hypothetical protein H6P81_020152 [Aristolochia fimbriata]|uniref:Uncharacterized protein n=1 Tax=Aristolochia fimbriata TaxID=158543 RepID=A0AAV7DTP8_ARIFI|nr:hypothetical protein H6P81_020152 [Aristolochia fimbriata]